MRLRARLVLMIAAAALLPIGVLGVAAVEISTSRLDERVSALQARSADGLAIFVETWLSARLRLLRQQVTTFGLGDLDEAGKAGFLRLVYRQVPEAGVVSLTTPDGDDVAPAVMLPPDADVGGDPGLQARPRVDSERARRFRAALPLARLATARANTAPGGAVPPVVGRPYRPDEGQPPVVAVAVAVPGQPLVLGIELSLAELERRFVEQADVAVDVVLLDGDAEAVLGGGSGLVVPERFRPFLATSKADGVRYDLEDGSGVLAASSPVPRVGWTVVLAEPASISAAATREIRDRTGFVGAIAAALSLVLGVAFSRTLSRPVIGLKDAALAVADGDLGRRVPAEGSDELAELSRAFNFMSGRLQANAAEIGEQRAEIERFNQELQDRVDERTRQLRETRDRLVQSARLAAVGEMGAGLAHELNNPVAGILGLVQVLVRRHAGSADEGLLRSVEQQAVRCKEILSRLLGFSQSDAAPDAPTAEVGTLDLDALLDGVLALVRGPLRQRDVSVDRQGQPGLTVHGDRAELERALAQVLLSLRAAAVSGGSVTVAPSLPPDGDRVHITLTLDAPRIHVGGDDWMASGMGFWAARQILAAHGGRLVEPEAPASSGRATWTVVLRPRA